MTLTRLPDGRYEVRIVVAGGKRLRRRFATERQARQFRDAVQLDRTLRDLGLPGIVARRPTLLAVLDAFEAAAATRGLAPATQDHYRFLLAGLRTWLIDVEGNPALLADELDDVHVRRYVRWRVGRTIGKGRRPASTVHAGKELTILAMAYREARITPRWSKPRRLGTVLGGGKRVLDPDQLEAFLAALPPGSLARTYAETAAGTGMRGVDLRKLLWTELDFAGRTLTFTAAKTGREHTIPMVESVAEHLTTWRATAPQALDGRVFHLNGRPLGRSTLRTAWRRASIAAKIDPPIEHLGLVRNAVAGLLLARGASPYLVSVLLGHADLRTTLGYARRNKPTKELRAAAAKLNRKPRRPGKERAE